MEEDDEGDFWADRLNIKCGGYNGVVDHQIYDVAKLIVEAREADGSWYCDDLAKRLGMTREHVELIQYILASVHYEAEEGQNYYANEPFTYGTSPRGLFVSNLESAKRFLAEFERCLEDR